MRMRFIFRNRGSMLSSLNEVSRIFFFMTLFFLSVLFSNITLQLTTLFATLLVALSAGVIVESLSFAKYVLFFSAVLSIISVLVAPGGTLLYQLSFVRITTSPLLFSLSMLIRMLSSVISLNLLLLAVNPDATIAFISRFGTKTAASLLVATRLLPVLTNEGDEVIQAFEARGFSIREGRFRQRLKSASRIVFPLLYSTMDRSISVAEAMEVRGFPRKWKRKKYFFSPVDYCQISVSAVAVGSALLLSSFGIGMSNYYATSSMGIQLPVAVLFVLLTFPFVPLIGRWSYNTGKGSELQIQY